MLIKTKFIVFNLKVLEAENSRPHDSVTSAYDEALVFDTVRR